VPTNKQIRVVVYAVSGAYSIALLVAGLQLPNNYLKVLSFLPAVIVLGFACYDKVLWRVQPIRFFVRNRPLLKGTWTGTLVSYQINEVGHEVAAAAIPIVVVIRQTYSAVSVTLMTAESRSRSLVSSIYTHGDRDFTLYYHYQNTPVLGMRKRSPIHFGGVAIDIPGLAPKHITGEYWTDRNSKGTFELTFQSPKCVGSFEDAILGEA
jgi:branched-subunit amino acid transport protein